MPFLVITRRRVESTLRPNTPVYRVIARQAVATLEEAHTLVTDAIYDAGLINVENSKAAYKIGKSGGSVGPLPGGETIDVLGGQKADNEMRAACPLILTSHWLRMTDAEKCAAYNSKQEST